MRRMMVAMIGGLLFASAVQAEVAIESGDPATVRLSPQGMLTYPVAPQPPHAPANYGAILSVDIDEPGRYHVAMSAPGWVDMIRDGKALDAAGDGHVDPGSGIAKIVDFDLVPGRYAIALSGMTAGEVTISVKK